MMQNLQQTLPLRDIKLPPDPGFWPLAPGWWALIALALLGLSGLVILWLKHRRRKRRWLAIEAQLGQIEFDYKRHQNKQKLLSELSMFLRRFVRFESHNQTATTWSGDAWINHLNQMHPRQSFAPFAEALSQGVYQAAHDYDETALLQTMHQVLKSQVMQPTKGGAHV